MIDQLQNTTKALENICSFNISPLNTQKYGEYGLALSGISVSYINMCKGSNPV